MTKEVKTAIQTALAQLGAEKSRLERQIAGLRAALGALGNQADEAVSPTRRKMSAKARKAIGKRMKAYWAKRRVDAKDKTKASSKPSRA